MSLPPRGERGLKSVGFAATLLLGESLPPRGASIKIGRSVHLIYQEMYRDGRRHISGVMPFSCCD